MAYLFAASGNTDQIDAGTGVTHASTFSLVVRLKVTQSLTTGGRMLVSFRDGSTINFALFFDTDATPNTITLLFTNGGGANFPLTFWPAQFTAGSVHMVGATVDGTNLRLYGDTDATAKSTDAITPAGAPDQGGGQHFRIGNDGFNQSADSTIYEVGYWAGTVLTGAQMAQLGGGTADGIAFPTHYWGLVSDAKALIGGQDGTVTGASVVGHSGTNLYGAAAQGLTISGNRVRGTAINNPNDIEGLTGTSLPNNQWAQATFATLNTGATLGVGCRWAAATAYSGYMAVALQGSPNTLKLYRYDAAVPTLLGTSSTAPTSGDLVRIEAISTAITVYLNETPVIAATDATYASGTAAWKVRDSSAVANGELDNALAGDFFTATATVLNPLVLTLAGGLLSINAKTQLVLSATGINFTGKTLNILEGPNALAVLNMPFTGKTLNVRAPIALDVKNFALTGQILNVSGIPFIPGQLIISNATINGLPPGQYAVSILVADITNHQLVASDPLPTIIMSSSGSTPVITFTSTYHKIPRVVLW